MKFSSGRIIFTCATLLLLVLGFVTFGLAAGSWHQMREHSHRATAFPHAQVLQHRLGILMLKPEHLLIGPTRALIAAGVVSAVSGFIACIGIFVDNKSPGLSRVFAVIASLSCTSIATTLATIIYTMTEEQKNPEWKYTGKYSTRGQYTLESWSCQIKNQPIGPEKGIFTTLCRSLTTARFLTIPLFITAMTVTGIAAITAYRRSL